MRGQHGSPSQAQSHCLHSMRMKNKLLLLRHNFRPSDENHILPTQKAVNWWCFQICGAIGCFVLQIIGTNKKTSSEHLHVSKKNLTSDLRPSPNEPALHLGREVQLVTLGSIAAEFTVPASMKAGVGEVSHLGAKWKDKKERPKKKSFFTRTTGVSGCFSLNKTETFSCFIVNLL